MSSQPPVISRLELNRPDVLTKLDLACREWGVFYLTEHGLDHSDTLFDEARAFFSAPHSTKYQVRRTHDNAWGYSDAEPTKDGLDGRECFDVGPERGAFVPQWPDWQPALRWACEAHYAACERLSFELLAAISGNLGVGGGFLFHAFEPDHASFVRLTCCLPRTALTVSNENDHADAGALTLLFTDDNLGLEAFVHDSWHAITPLAGALTISVGDVIRVWSTDRYTAPRLRVRCRGHQALITAPFFFRPRESRAQME